MCDNGSDRLQDPAPDLFWNPFFSLSVVFAPFQAGGQNVSE